MELSTTLHSLIFLTTAASLGLSYAGIVFMRTAEARTNSVPRRRWMR
jgi:hypothetical protein